MLYASLAGIIVRVNIAFVTSAQYRELTDDDRLAANALAERGARVEGVVWNDPSANWAGFDCIVVRSTWDYYRHATQFREWLNTLFRSGRAGVESCMCASMEYGKDVPRRSGASRSSCRAHGVAIAR
ncbi:MAG: hypothetical protein M3R65_06550, partial [Gemmatimonadota bacterium]|nr:hypothetical protein [Gemmatimonadota bacterium]